MVEWQLVSQFRVGLHLVLLIAGEAYAGFGFELIFSFIRGAWLDEDRPVQLNLGVSTPSNILRRLLLFHFTYWFWTKWVVGVIFVWTQCSNNRLPARFLPELRHIRRRWTSHIAILQQHMLGVSWDCSAIAFLGNLFVVIYHSLRLFLDVLHWSERLPRRHACERDWHFPWIFWDDRKVPSFDRPKLTSFSERSIRLLLVISLEVRIFGQFRPLYWTIIR